MSKSLYIKIAAMLVVIAFAGIGLTALTAPRGGRQAASDTPPASDDAQTVRIVTSFYPVYVAALNVAGGIDGVEVVNMVNGQFGCLHDYQMSPQDRATLDTADVFVMNGAGAEPFLEAVPDEETAFTVIELCDGLPLLESGHIHEHGEHPHDREHEDTEEAVNGHLWVSPRRYTRQIEALRDGLMAADPAHAAEYERRAAEYLAAINAVWQRLQTAAQPFGDTKTVLFHDSLAYLAEDLGLHVAVALNVGEDSGVSTDTVKQAEEALRGEEQVMFLYDSQYSTVGYTYLQEIPRQAIVLTVDTCVTGDGRADSWLNAMTALCEAWEAAYES